MIKQKEVWSYEPANLQLQGEQVYLSVGVSHLTCMIGDDYFCDVLFQLVLILPVTFA